MHEETVIGIRYPLDMRVFCSLEAKNHITTRYCSKNAWKVSSSRMCHKCELSIGFRMVDMPMRLGNIMRVTPA